MSSTELPKHVYPPTAVLKMLRMMLLALGLAMIAVSVVARALMVPEGLHRVFFFICAFLAFLWMFKIESYPVITACSSLLTTLFVFRSVELILWGDSNSVQNVSAINWTLTAVWCFALGVINQATVSQKQAEVLWKSLAQRET